MHSTHLIKTTSNSQLHIKSRGFTLVELMVSLSVFSIVMTISVGSLLILVDANAKAQALYSSTTNLSFALDAMTREIRTGHDYYCNTRTSGNYGFDEVPAIGSRNDCTAGNFIAFTREKDNIQSAYRLNNSRIDQFDGASGRWVTITSDRDVAVDSLSFVVDGSASYNASGNKEQPTVTVFISGRISNGLEVETRFNIQTRVVGRRLDII